MKKSILLAARLGLAAAAVLICAGCDEPEDYNKNNGSDDLNTFLGVVNGKFPNTPSGVTVTNISARGVTVRWSPASKAEEYYVYREESASDGYYDYCGTERYQYDNSYKVGSTRSTSYSDTGLTSGASYCYTVTAVNKYGETPRSRAYKVTTTATPQSPEGITATAKSSDSVVISWSRVSDAKSYNVYRSTAVYGAYAPYAHVGKTTLRSYTDTGLNPSTTYYYKVSASNEAGESELSYYVSCTTPKYHEYGTLPDGRDGKMYKTVEIGNQTWMAENLNYTVDGSWCYDNKESNCKTYGRLYQWAAAMDIDASYNGIPWYEGSDINHKGVCPTGWHLPSRREWGDLAKTAGGTGDYGDYGTAGEALKAISGWYSVGTNEFGFSALPGGKRQTYPQFFDAGTGGGGYWWSATENNGYYSAYIRVIKDYNDYLGEESFSDNSSKHNGLSVRCIKNE